MDLKINQPLVSVLLPIHNESPYFNESSKSILEQTYKNIELIIIYDGNNANLYNSFTSSDKRISFLHGNKKGIAAALNLGIKFSKGEYIARMDVDDISYLNRIEDQLKFLLKNALDVCSTNLKLIPNNRILFFPESDNEIKFWLTFASTLAHPGIFIKSNILKQFQYNELLPAAEDYDLWTRIAKEGYIFGNIKTPVLQYRIHNNQGSTLNKLQPIESIKIANNYSNNYFHKPVLILSKNNFGFNDNYTQENAIDLIINILILAKENNINIYSGERYILSIFSKINNINFNIIKIILQLNKIIPFSIKSKLLFYSIFRILLYKININTLLKNI